MVKLWFQTPKATRIQAARRFEGIPLRELGLSIRTQNALLRHDPNMSVADVIRADASIAKVRNMGPKAIEELDTKVSHFIATSDSNAVLRVGPQSTDDVEFSGPWKLSAVTLPDSIRDQSIEQFNLDTRGYNALVRSGITTVGALFDTSDANLKSIHGVGDYLLRTLNKVRFAILNSITPENELDWLKYCAIQGMKMLPEEYESGASLAKIIAELPRITKAILYQHFDERSWIVIQRRYGLEGSANSTLEELGNAFRLTRERIRQIEEKALGQLRRVLIEHQFSGTSYRVHPEILRALKSVSDFAVAEANTTISENELLTRFRHTFSVDAEELKPPLSVLFAAAGIDHIDFENPNLTSIWGPIPLDERRNLRLQINRLDRILTRENPRPLTEYDILVQFNKGVDKSKKVGLSQLRSLIDLCGSIERREDGMVWGKFEAMKGRGNQVERLLIVYDRPMNGPEIVREMNRRLVLHGKHRIQLRTIINQIHNDGRFVPIGRSGHWGLASWQQLETRSILEVMEQCLIILNKPSTINEIYEYVSSRRPVSKQSIIMYLGSEEIFTRIDRARWGLTFWPEAQNTKGWNPSQVADFLVRTFKERKTKELDYRILRQLLVDAAGVNARQAQGLLNSNPAIKICKGKKVGELYAVFLPDYREKLGKSRGAAMNKRTTLRQKVDNSVQRILHESPERQLPLSELIARLQGEYDCPTHTLYQYVAGLEYVERLDDPETSARICRLKNRAEGFSFSQVKEIANDDLRKKIERALSYFTENEVDIGLFLLSKEFEAVLKSYFVVTASKDQLPSNLGKDPDKWKLVSMVDCAKDKGIITDLGVFQLLRQERNERAHGSMPTLAERRALMHSALYLGGLYIDYIKIVDDLLNKFNEARNRE